MAYEKFVVEVEFTDGVWADLTSRADTIAAPIQAVQGDTAETTDEGSLTVTFYNGDQALTPGNTLSPYYPNVRAGRRIRIREVIPALSQIIDVFTGFIEFPETEAWTASSDDNPRDQQITVTAVDRMTWLTRARTFTSTLAEHIRYAAGNQLRAYYPLSDDQQAKSAANISATVLEPLTRRMSQRASGSATGASTPTLTWGAGTPLEGDDIPPATSVPAVNAGSWYANVFGEAKFATPLAQSSGESIALVYWCTYDGTAIDVLVPATIRNSDTLSLQQDMLLYYSSVSGGWFARWHPPGSTLTEVAVSGPQASKPTLIALRLTLPSGLCEFWRDDDEPVTTTLLGGIPASATWSSLAVFGPWAGSVGHLQVHIGTDAYTRSQHLAQFQAGWHGLERQTSGQRIRTLAAYAGIPSTELNRVDPGVAVMQNTSLAGKNPAAAMSEAADTERGSLYAAGTGELVFADRRRLYNI